jgi:hypothetical protein
VSFIVTASLGPALIDGDETLEHSQGEIRAMSSEVLTAPCTKRLSTIGAHNAECIVIRIDWPQLYDLHIENMGPAGKTGDPYNWIVPAGMLMYMLFRFEQSENLPVEGNWVLWLKRYLVRVET